MARIGPLSDAAPERLSADQRHAFTAAFLGWTMDAFDYFIVVLVYADIAKDFGVSLTPLIVDVCFYSVVAARGLRPELAMALRVQHRAGVHQLAHPREGARVRRLGGGSAAPRA
jgi:hypothetical protein